MKIFFSLVTIVALSLTAIAQQPQVKKDTVEGITNLARIESTVACAGAITPNSVAEIKKMGFSAIINLRQATEPGANIEAEAAAAKTAGINFYHIPFNGSSPDPAVVDKFLKTIVERGAQPAFIHCAGGNRAAAMWFIKRVMVDKWENEKALAEATALGFTSQPLKTFAQDYIAKNKQ